VTDFNQLFLHEQMTSLTQLASVSVYADFLQTFSD